MAQASDDGFHEIQLNGKQLVFLFMAATVVSVVIFLCGVLVGRGVRSERGTVADATVNAPTADIQPPTAGATAPPAVSAESDPTAAAPPPTVDDLSYYNRLEQSKQPVEALKPPSTPPADLPKAATKPSREASRETSKEAPKAATSPVPAPVPARVPPEAAPQASEARPSASPDAQASVPVKGPSDYAVQIAALNVRSEADAIAKKMSAKGYAAYVVSPSTGTPSVYRVRIGAYKTRREAETVAAKLQKEEQFKPWVTR